MPSNSHMKNDETAEISIRERIRRHASVKEGFADVRKIKDCRRRAINGPLFAAANLLRHCLIGSPVLRKLC